MACQKVSKQGGDDAKVNVLAKPHSPYIFFTLQVDSAWESSITSHKFTNCHFMAVALFSGHFLLQHGLGTRLVRSSSMP